MNGTRLPSDWQPNPNLRFWSEQRRPDLDINEAIEQFRDYWCGLSGKGACKLDWDRTFRNFIRSPMTRQAPKTSKPAPHQPAQPASTRLSDEQRSANLNRLGSLLGGLLGAKT